MAFLKSPAPPEDRKFVFQEKIGKVGWEIEQCFHCNSKLGLVRVFLKSSLTLSVWCWWPSHGLSHVRSALGGVRGSPSPVFFFS